MSNSILAASKRLGKLAILSASVSTASLAQAAFILEIDDDLTDSSGLARLTITDGGDGVVNFTGDYAGFTFTSSTGVTEPAIADPAKMGLDSLEISGDADILYIWLTNTAFTGPAPGFMTDFGGTTQGTVDLEFLHNGSVFAMGDSVSSSTGGTAFSGSSTTAVAPSDPYSLTIFATVEHTGAGQFTSFDALITTVPVPAAAWLFGSALAGLGFLRRK